MKINRDENFYMVKLIFLLSAMVGQGICAENASSTLKSDLTFSLQSDKHHLTFKSVDLRSLTEHDRDTFVDYFGSWNNLESQFGFLPALIIKPVAALLPNSTLHGLFKDVMDRMLEKTPSGVVQDYSWFLLDGYQNNKFIGHVNLTFYPHPVPNSDPNAYYYNVGMSLIPSYQKQGIATNFAEKFIAHLKDETTIPVTKILIRTRADHLAVHKLTNKFDFVKHLGTKTTHEDLGFFSTDILEDFYEIDLQK